MVVDGGAKEHPKSRSRKCPGKEKDRLRSDVLSRSYHEAIQFSERGCT